MKIVIVGAGRVGYAIAEQLLTEGHDITVVESDPERAAYISSTLDVIVVEGRANVDQLRIANVADADLLIAATTSDETNLISCMVGRKLGATHTIARVRDEEYYQDVALLQDELGLSLSINPERTSAKEISRTLRFPAATKVEPFANGLVELVEFKLREGSKLDGLRLNDFRGRYSDGILICAVEREGSVTIPNGDFVLAAGDYVTVVGAPHELHELFRKIGEFRHEAESVIIIGGGPAGLSAAMTARNRNLTVCVICGGAADSALYKAGHVTNYPGVPDVSGPALLETMTQQARDLGADMLRERALSAMPMGKTFGVSAGKEFAEGRALLLATGIAQRGTFPGEAEFLGRGVSYCATCDGMLYRGKRAAVIGLAADAPAEADFLREIGCDVQYYDGKKHRFEIRGTERADALVVDGTAEPADVIFILRAGFAADTLLPGIATEKGHIVVDESYAASIPGVFAAGDCTGAPYQIPAAVGEGNRAALSVVRWLRNA